uniref:DUF1524 domain-containing protein n=1 Tax=Steinernema glaseri TaxID=37863 RepID=A0A1I7ZTP7_9BILA
MGTNNRPSLKCNHSMLRIFDNPGQEVNADHVNHAERSNWKEKNGRKALDMLLMAFRSSLTPIDTSSRSQIMIVNFS